MILFNFTFNDIKTLMMFDFTFNEECVKKNQYTKIGCVVMLMYICVPINLVPVHFYILHFNFLNFFIIVFLSPLGYSL